MRRSLECINVVFKTGKCITFCDSDGSLAHTMDFPIVVPNKMYIFKPKQATNENVL